MNNKEELRIFFDAEAQIEKAISELFLLENKLKNTCEEIKSSLGFDFAGISLVSLERNTIEAVDGSGRAKGWSGRSKHYLEKNQDLRDIQADIVETRCTEIICGKDRRFDTWIYEEFDHGRIIRVFTPILLVQDQHGNIIEDWPKNYQWEKIFTEANTERDWRRVFQTIPFPSEFEVITIGTVEAGYENRDRQIEDQQVFNLVDLLAQKALNIWQSQLTSVLKIIAEKARQIMKADSATLHFLYEPGDNHYIHQVFSGNVGWNFLRNSSPRRDGLGRQAIRAGTCKYIPDPAQGQSTSDMENLHKQAFDAGIRALVAFPLKVECQDQISCQEEALCQAGIICQEGVFYVAFQQEHKNFTEEELHWGQLFANHAADAIRHATIYEQNREREQQLTTLHSVAQSLHQTPKKNILRRIAWDTSNILAADIVTIYEYTRRKKDFEVPPEIAGKLKAEQKMNTGMERHNIPFSLLERGKNYYVTDLNKDDIFKDAEFSRREDIKSVAGILIKFDEEIVGVMFINYRRLHHFTDEEIKIIDIIASSAAIAIKNQRWLTVRSKIDRKIITTLDRHELLNLIVEEAVEFTGANFSSIRLLDPDPSKEMLVIEAKYPKNAVIDQNRISTDINEGITGWVARELKSALVDDVESDQWKQYYKACFPNVRSELCVPLLDEKHHLLGILNVEGEKVSAFDDKHQHMLEALSNLAAIGVQNIKNKQHLVNMETLINLGDLATPLLHKMRNKIGVIRELSQDIIDRDDSSKQDASIILFNADQLTEEIKILKDWTTEKSKITEVNSVISQALSDAKILSNIEQNIDLPIDSPQVLAGQHQLLNVFGNLIQNAVDAMPNGGRLSIKVSSWRKNDQSVWIKIQISDNGVGIAQKDLERIFDRDYTTKDDTKGTGYGLCWTRFYIQRLGGNIPLPVSSLDQSSRGTVFTIILPCHNSD